MKIISKVALVIGVLALLAAVGVMIWAVLYTWGNMQPKNSLDAINPYPLLWSAFGLGTLGGFLTGLGIGKAPRREPLPLES